MAQFLKYDCWFFLLLCILFYCFLTSLFVVLLLVPKEQLIFLDKQFVLLVLRMFCLLYPVKIEPKKIAYSVVNGTMVCDRWENRRIRLPKWVYTTVCIRLICVIYTYYWSHIWIDRRHWTVFNSCFIHVTSRMRLINIYISTIMKTNPCLATNPKSIWIHEDTRFYIIYLLKLLKIFGYIVVSWIFVGFLILVWRTIF